MEPLKRYKKGTPIEACELNKMVDKVNRLENLRVQSPLAIQKTSYGDLISAPNVINNPQILLGKWLGSNTPQTTGKVVWALGELQPVEIFGGHTPGSETDKNKWFNVQNWYGAVMPSSFVIIGNNGYGWYLIGATETLLLGYYGSSPSTTYWKPGTYQDVEVYTGSPYSETDASFLIPNVANRFGAIAGNTFVWIVYSQFDDTAPNDAGWYAIAPQGMNLLTQYIGTDPWFYGDAVGTNLLKVYGGTTPGSETDQSWFLNDAFNYSDDIVPTSVVPTPWLWVNSNASCAGITGYDYNWYVVANWSEKPCLSATIYSGNYSAASLLQWQNYGAGVGTGFTTTDSKNFNIPDNRKYLVNCSVSVAQNWTATNTGWAGDYADIKMQLLVGGTGTIFLGECRVGYTSAEDSGGTTHWGDTGEHTLSLTAFVEGSYNETLAISIPNINAISPGSGSSVSITYGTLTITPFDQG